jgi:hypothetical protein
MSLAAVLAVAGAASGVLKGLDPVISNSIDPKYLRLHPELAKILGAAGSMAGMSNLSGAANAAVIKSSAGGLRNSAFVKATTPFEPLTLNEIANKIKPSNGSAPEAKIMPAEDQLPAYVASLNKGDTSMVPDAPDYSTPAKYDKSVSSIDPMADENGQLTAELSGTAEPSPLVSANPTTVAPTDKNAMIGYGIQGVAGLAQIAGGLIANSQNKAPVPKSLDFMKKVYNDASVRAQIGLPVIEQNRMKDEIEGQKRELIASGASSSMGSSGTSYNRAMQAMSGADKATLDLMIADEKFKDEKVRESMGIGTQLAGVMADWDKQAKTDEAGNDQAVAGLIGAGMAGVNNIGVQMGSTEFYKNLSNRNKKAGQ